MVKSCAKSTKEENEENVNVELIENEDELPEKDKDTSESENKTKAFNCPTCKTVIKFDTPTGNDVSQQWAEIFPDNHFIANLIEKVEMHFVENNCESCSKDGSVSAEKAVKWCQTCKIAFCDSCIKAHDVIKACRDHVVLSLSDMRSDPLQSIRNTRKEISCMQHRDKILEYYCVDCHVAICSTCAAVQHRRCELVEPILDAVQKLKPEQEFLQNDLEKQTQLIKDWEVEYEKEVKELAINKENLIKEMSSLRFKINEALLNLENKFVQSLDEKHKETLVEASDRLREVEVMKKNVVSTNKFVKTLIQFGSDSELLSIFDMIKVKVDDLRSNIQKAKINKLNKRFKIAFDPCIQRILEIKSFGKIVDVVDLNKENFLSMNGYEEHLGSGTHRKPSVKRVGTFRVDKPSDGPGTPIQNSSSATSTSSESVSSQEMAPPVRSRRSMPAPRPFPRESKTPTPRTIAARSGTMPRQPRTPRPSSVTRFHSQSNSDMRTRSDNNNNENKRTPVKKPLDDALEKRIQQRIIQEHNANVKTQEKSKLISAVKISSNDINRIKFPEKAALQEKSKSTPLLFTINGRTDGDAKKCWPLDVAVLEDGTPVITDFHNKKVKAFSAAGSVMGQVTVPSWPHGIVDVSSRELAVTLPELATIVFTIVQDSSMRIRKRIRTAKQYRGISCDAISDPNNPCLVASCCASGNQSVDILTLDGVIINTFREDYRSEGHLLFSWPYYVTTNNQGDIIVSDCQARNGVICLSRTGKVKYDQLLPDNVVRDPRGICTDRHGNLLLADKVGNAVHCLGTDGMYQSVLLTSVDGLDRPIAVCLSPYGHLIVTQENGDIKIFKHG
ncbi:hypothetical protein KUTeg_006522 [Tegillarca granosa]|uniref:B box-type domain-containing protein n=1 Tax=Tegillarca granosa TaxID=220873 RepID=A0ABQ9FGP8_TEGGR|nr:hypothetical protein KUTeg_006522 [Tegillarca granosa]